MCHLPRIFNGSITKVTIESDRARFPTNMNSRDLVGMTLKTAVKINKFPKVPIADAKTKMQRLDTATTGDSWTNSNRPNSLSPVGETDQPLAFIFQNLEYSISG